MAKATHLKDEFLHDSKKWTAPVFTPDITFNSKVEESRALVTIAGCLTADGTSAPEHAGINSALDQDPLKGWHRRICVTDFHIHGGYRW